MGSGDYVDEATTRGLVRKTTLLPTYVLKEQPSHTYCEDQVIEHYKKTAGQTRGQALVNYMTIVESMPTYGVHYFEVYDKRSSSHHPAAFVPYRETSKTLRDV